jgi:hypothetical protein
MVQFKTNLAEPSKEVYGLKTRGFANCDDDKGTNTDRQSLG